ncbi:MAG: YihY/virulence factor BrkB family protein [Xanthobacteraceae bacterium]|jgi:membrane protein
MVTSETKPGATSEAWRVALVLGLLAATALAQHFVPAEKRWSRLESHQNVSRADAETESEGRGRDAKFPSDIPAKGWKDILLRTYTNIGEHRILALAAGVTYYSILAIFPAIAALVAIYGLFSDPAGIAKHLDEISSVAPGGAIEVAREQLTRVSSKGSETLGLTFVIGLAISLWSANAAMKSLFDTLNIIYGEREKRSFIKLNAISLAFTVAGIVFILAALGAVVIVPVVLNYFWLSNAADLFIRIARWPVMFVGLAFALACIYRFGPSREAPRWRWITWGSIAATIVWLAASALFSWYAASFGQFNQTYGSLGAAVGFMTWLWISAIVLLLGAELDAEMEHQTAFDTTTGAPKPMGTRGAQMADTLGASQGS